MKKYQLLVAPLLVLPFVIGCNNGGGDKPTEVKFSLSGTPTLDGKVATVNVDWTPTDSIKFESFTFTATPSKENTVTFAQTGDPRPMPVTITFKDDVTEDISGTLKFSYEDVTAKSKGESSLTFAIPKPEPVDPYIVNEDEFNAALAFTGEEYLQVETSGDGEGITTLQIDECSPNIYHYVLKFHMTQPVTVDQYDESYVYKMDDSTYKKISRDDETTPWEGINWVDASEEYDWDDPQKIGAGLKYQMGEIEFDPSKYNPNTHSYTLENASGFEFVFKFENKKLIYLNFAGEQEATFTYNQEAPELPIDPPTE